MKRFFRILVGAATVSALAAMAAAQTAPGILNTLEVQRLAAAPTPAAHATLARHYMVMADEFARDADRFDALARVPSGNANHSIAIGPNARRARQIQTARALSERARKMAVYHQFLSINASAVVPADRAMFDGGFAARVPTAMEIKAAVAAARTAAEHHVLEEYFRTMAARSTADANEHAAMAKQFRVGGQRPGFEFAAMHCDRLVNDAREAARRASTAAARQRQLADIG